ncbi:MAG: sulfatase-like hydrolase/transferase [Phycisphaeraceae bacterium]|nr:sulfatase-like hydrolase/transferase [Phycisphaeraceae bacterium]
MEKTKMLLWSWVAATVLGWAAPVWAGPKNVVLVMADDQGWGQVSYYNHPTLQTPNLDAMARNGLRFDRFYAAGPVCSPTRASVLTGRTHDRTGVPTHGHALRLQEKTISAALKKAGYATAHFGKWHLNGIRGPGVPVLATDAYHPGRFGFDHWLTVTNFFDRNPLMSRMGRFEEFKGDSSEVIVAEALKFIEQQKAADKPFFTVIWYGSPHSPFVATESDQPEGASGSLASHLGEIVALDRSVGTLRAGLKKMGLDQNTLLWYCSDNGGLKVDKHAVGGLRGRKGSIWEGGIRVPGIIEWPGGIRPRVTAYPASTMDIMPTLVDLLGLPENSMLEKIDGVSLKPLFEKEIGPRARPIPFQFLRSAALVDNNLKIVLEKKAKGKYQLFDLAKDKNESNDLFASHPQAGRLQKALDVFRESVAASRRGADYPEGKVTKDGPHGRFWYTAPEYRPHLETFAERPEYKKRIQRGRKKRKNR